MDDEELIGSRFDSGHLAHWGVGWALEHRDVLTQCPAWRCAPDNGRSGTIQSCGDCAALVPKAETICRPEPW